jgi:hypothetical protein
MTRRFKEYTVEIVDNPGLSPGSADNNLIGYYRVYSDDTEYQPTSKHGIRITKEGQSVSSAIICGTGGATGMLDNSFLITAGDVLICCSDTVFSFKLPELTLNWRRQLDAATCFAIYPFEDDFIVHGELEIKRIDGEGNVKWNFSAKDIFVTQDGKEAVKLIRDTIEVTDWDGHKYILNGEGQVNK